ncbi:hypothetical protein PtB15_18B120 [Puccinia triticina]|nr:hypothetical protein PtB15_18B120 [Puccinia triticina]
MFFSPSILLSYFPIHFSGSWSVAASSDCQAPAPYKLKTPPFTTDWTVGASPWPEYSPPLLRRQHGINLNGPWQFKPAKKFKTHPTADVASIVKFWHLSRWKCFATIFVNGKSVGFHRGGYFKFSLDLTDALKGPGQENELLVFVYDPTDSKDTLIPLGNEGLGQFKSSEIELTPKVKELDPTRTVLSVSGWRDSGAGDFHDNHHYPYPQCGTPFYSLPSTPYNPARIAVQGEFSEIGHIPDRQNLWNVQSHIDTLNQTYKVASSIEIWNYRAICFVEDLRDQAQLFSCSGGVFTVSIMSDLAD